MKRTIGIFLIILSLIVGTGPVLSFHFCGGTLQSMQVFPKDNHQSCCGYNMENNISTTDAYGNAIVKETTSGCCATQIIRFSTDYNEPASKSVILTEAYHELLHPICFVADFSPLLNRISLPTKNYFTPPLPEFHFLNDADINTYICSYII